MNKEIKPGYSSAQNNRFENNKSYFEKRADDIKQNLFLPGFLIDNFGYKLIQKSGQEYVLNGGNAGTVHVFRDKKYGTNTWMFKKFGHNTSGNVFHYLSKYERYGSLADKSSWDRIYELAEKYTPLNTDLEISKLNKENFPQEKPDLSLLPLESYSYLTSRGLDKELLFSDKYENKIVNKLQESYKEGKLSSFLNIAFPLVDKNGNLSSFEMKNKGMKADEKGHVRSFSGKVKFSETDAAIWQSNVPKEKWDDIVSGKSNLEAINIGEAIVGLISYNQLNPHRQKDSVDISFNGSLSTSQIPVIQELINYLQPKSINLVNDRDVAGFYYDLKLLTQLERPGSDRVCEPKINVNHALDISQKGYHMLEINVKTDRDNGITKNSVLTKIGEIGERIHQANKILNSFEISGINYNETFGRADFTVRYYHNIPNEKAILNAFNDVLNKDNFFKIDKAQPLNLGNSAIKIKDWNERLMQEKGLNKDNIQTNNNPYYFQKLNNPDMVVNNLKDIRDFNFAATTVVAYPDKMPVNSFLENYKKVGENKWVEVSKDMLTQKEHLALAKKYSLKGNYFPDLKTKHKNLAGQLSNKILSDKEILKIFKDKYQEVKIYAEAYNGNKIVPELVSESHVRVGAEKISGTQTDIKSKLNTGGSKIKNENIVNKKIVLSKDKMAVNFLSKNNPNVIKNELGLNK